MIYSTMFDPTRLLQVISLTPDREVVSRGILRSDSWPSLRNQGSQRVGQAPLVARLENRDCKVVPCMSYMSS